MVSWIMFLDECTWIVTEMDRVKLTNLFLGSWNLHYLMDNILKDIDHIKVVGQTEYGQKVPSKYASSWEYRSDHNMSSLFTTRKMSLSSIIKIGFITGSCGRDLEGCPCAPVPPGLSSFVEESYPRNSYFSIEWKLTVNLTSLRRVTSCRWT